MKSKIAHVFWILHYLSLDVVAGAVLSSIMFWKMPDGNGQANKIVLLVLGICTWIVYIFDRLLDNLKLEPEDKRHQFHFDNQYYLQVVIIVLLFIAFFLLFFLPKSVIIFGFAFMFFLLLYFRVLQKQPVTSNYHSYKEIATAWLYSMPVFGSVFSGKSFDLWQALSAFNFVLLVHQSILVFSWYEINENIKVKNFAQKLGRKRVQQLVVSITVLMGMMLLISIGGYMKKVFMIEFMMASATLVIFLSFRKLALNQRYRWLGEMVFWLPGLIIFS